MPQKKEPRFVLKGVDEFFTTQEMRDDAKLARIHEIALDEIDEFPDHPYKVQDDEDMLSLMESIRENGVLTPATVRRKEDGRYEMLSGHRRLRASRLLGNETLRCEIVDLDRDAATIFMCDSNLQRTTILPSEKAFAYKMRLEAMKRQGKRNDLTSGPMGPRYRSNAQLASEVNESTTQIKRYIRLTELIPAILDMVDEGRIAMRPAVEISYLPEDMQESLLDSMMQEACTPTHVQALRMKGLSEKGELTAEIITTIMQEEKPNQKDKIILRSDRTRKYLPKNLPPAQRESYIIKALEFYAKHREKHRDDMER